MDCQLSRRHETTSFIYNENNNSIRHLRHRAKCSGWSGSASTCPSSSKHAPLQGHHIHIQAVISANDSWYSFHQEIVLLSQYSVLALFQYSYQHLLGSDCMFVLNKNRRPSLSLPTILCSLSGAVDILSAAIASVSKCIPEIFWSAVSCHSKEHYIIIDRQTLQVMP